MNSENSITTCSSKISHPITYQFYQDYLDDPVFSKKMTIRKQYLINKYQLKVPDDQLIQEYFVELFSWTALDKWTLEQLDKVIEKYVPKATLIDPCSGNSFHTFLFHQFCQRPVITIDIQPELNAWINTITADGLEYLQELDNHQDKVLILSWIDFTQFRLPYNLLTNFHGKMVISIGNYRPHNCGDYLQELQKSFRLLQFYECLMPWGLTEEIGVYLRK